MKIKTETTLLLAVLTASLGMRILPIAADLPSFSSFDELSYIEAALRFGTGTFAPSSFLHGGLYQLVLFVEFAAYFALGRVFGIFSSSTDFYVAYLKDPSHFFLLGRATVVLCGVGVVWLSYAIASTTYQRRVGVLASVFTAFSLLIFQVSFLALADLPAVFLLMLAVYLVVRSVGEPSERRLYCAAAALVGLATAAKYHVAFGVVTLCVAAVMKCWDRQDRAREILKLTMVGAVLVAVGFCVGIPQVVLDPIGFYDDVFHKLSGHYLGVDSGRSAVGLLFTQLRDGLGIPLEVTLVLGFGFALYKRSKWDLLMLSFPVSFYLLFMHSVGFAYHLLPAVPFLLILASRVLDALVERILGRESLGVSLCLALLVVAPTFLDSIRLVQVMRSPSTKAAAKTWIEKRLPAGTRLMAEGYVFTAPAFSPPLLENPVTLKRDIADAVENRGTGRTASLRLANYDRLYNGARAYDILKVTSLRVDTIAAAAPRYLVMTSNRDAPVGTDGLLGSADYVAKREALKQRIQREYTILATIAPTTAFTNFFPHFMDEDYRLLRSWSLFSRDGSRGPIITIWEKRAS